VACPRAEGLSGCDPLIAPTSRFTAAFARRATRASALTQPQDRGGFEASAIAGGCRRWPKESGGCRVASPLPHPPYLI